MSLFQKLVPLGCVALLAVACSERLDPTSAVTPAAQALRGGLGENPQPRPFEGSMRGVVHWAWTTVCAYQPVRTLTDGVAEVTHLGKVTITAAHCSSANGQAALDGEMTLIAANGDRLVGTYTAHVVAPPPAEAGCEGKPMCIAEEGVFTVTGGTGRFAHATGSVTLTVGAYPTDMPPTIESQWPALQVFHGTITY